VEEGKNMKILGYEYKLDITQSARELDAIGKFFASELMIKISKDLPKNQLESTLLHEILEALNYHLDLKLEHDTIMRLETSLYTVLSDNGVSFAPLFKEII
jgi:hypothetical protein